MFLSLIVYDSVYIRVTVFCSNWQYNDTVLHVYVYLVIMYDFYFYI